MTSKYGINGKAHRILRSLQNGKVTEAEICELLRGPTQTDQGAKARASRTLRSLRHDRYVESVDAGEAWVITRAGQHAYDDLEQALHRPAAPTVRIFAKEAAHG